MFGPYGRLSALIICYIFVDHVKIHSAFYLFELAVLALVLILKFSNLRGSRFRRALTLLTHSHLVRWLRPRPPPSGTI